MPKKPTNKEKDSIVKDLKNEIFDLLEQQQAYQFKINELEKVKSEKYKKLNEIRNNGE